MVPQVVSHVVSASKRLLPLANGSGTVGEGGKGFLRLLRPLRGRPRQPTAVAGEVPEQQCPGGLIFRTDETQPNQKDTNGKLLVGDGTFSGDYTLLALRHITDTRDQLGVSVGLARQPIMQGEPRKLDRVLGNDNFHCICPNSPLEQLRFAGNDSLEVIEGCGGKARPRQLHGKGSGIVLGILRENPCSCREPTNCAISSWVALSGQVTSPFRLMV